MAPADPRALQGLNIPGKVIGQLRLNMQLTIVWRMTGVAMSVYLLILRGILMMNQEQERHGRHTGIYW